MKRSRVSSASALRRVGLLVAVGILALTLAGCGVDRTPPSGVTLVDGRVVVAFKPCPTEPQGLRELHVIGPVDQIVWSAVLEAGATPSLELPIRSAYPGYRITTSLPDGTLDDATRYSTEAVAEDGTEWNGPDLHPEDLTEGTVRVAGRELDFSDWADQPSTCPTMSWWAVGLTGAVVAVVAGGSLLILRRGIGLVRRRFER